MKLRIVLFIIALFIVHFNCFSIENVIWPKSDVNNSTSVSNITHAAQTVTYKIIRRTKRRLAVPTSTTNSPCRKKHAAIEVVRRHISEGPCKYPKLCVSLIEVVIT